MAARTLSPALSQCGRIAVISILAALAIAGVMAFPYDKAAAQGIHHGYTYTERICQEYGQQPRWYYVRDPIAGSDWNDNGGWTIVLLGGASVGYTFGPPSFSDGGAVPDIELATGAKTQLTDRSQGLTGFAIYTPNDEPIGYVVIDRNNDRQIDIAGDRTAGAANDRWEIRTYDTVASGGRYIRWAYMRFCR